METRSLSLSSFEVGDEGLLLLYHAPFWESGLSSLGGAGFVS